MNTETKGRMTGSGETCRRAGCAHADDHSTKAQPPQPSSWSSTTSDSPATSVAAVYARAAHAPPTDSDEAAFLTAFRSSPLVRRAAARPRTGDKAGKLPTTLAAIERRWFAGRRSMQQAQAKATQVAPTLAAVRSGTHDLEIAGTAAILALGQGGMVRTAPATTDGFTEVYLKMAARRPGRPKSDPAVAMHRSQTASNASLPVRTQLDGAWALQPEDRGVFAYGVRRVLAERGWSCKPWDDTGNGVCDKEWRTLVDNRRPNPMRKRRPRMPNNTKIQLWDGRARKEGYTLALCAVAQQFSGSLSAVEATETTRRYFLHNSIVEVCHELHASQERSFIAAFSAEDPTQDEMLTRPSHYVPPVAVAHAERHNRGRCHDKITSAPTLVAPWRDAGLVSATNIPSETNPTESNSDDVLMPWVEQFFDRSEQGFSSSSSEVLFDSSSAGNFDSSSDDNDNTSNDVAPRSASTAGIWLPLEHVSSTSPLPVACANGSQSDSVHDGSKRRLDGTGENSDVHMEKKMCQGASIGSRNFTTDLGSRPKVKINTSRTSQAAAILFSALVISAFMTVMYHSSGAETSDKSSNGISEPSLHPSLPPDETINGRWWVGLPIDDKSSCNSSDETVPAAPPASRTPSPPWPRWISPPVGIGSENRAALMWTSRPTADGVISASSPGVLSVFQFPSVDVLDPSAGWLNQPGSATTNSQVSYGTHTGCLDGETDLLRAAPNIGTCSVDPVPSPIGMWRMQIPTKTRETTQASWTVTEIPDYSSNGFPHDTSPRPQQPNARNDPLVWMTDFGPHGKTEIRPMFYGGYGCGQPSCTGQMCSPCSPTGLTDMWYFDGEDDIMWRPVDKTSVQLDISSVNTKPGVNSLDVDTVWSHFGGGMIGVSTWTAAIPRQSIPKGSLNREPRHCLMVFGTLVVVIYGRCLPTSRPNEMLLAVPASLPPPALLRRAGGALRGRWDLGPTNALWGFCHERLSGGKVADDSKRSDMQFPPGGASWALLTGTTLVLPLPLTGVAKVVSYAFSEGEQPPLSVKSALNPCIGPSDCPSARIRAASWSGAFQGEYWGSVPCRKSGVENVAGCKDFSAASTGSKHTAFIYGGLGVQGSPPASQRGADPQLESVMPLHDMWRLTADFLTGAFHWKRVEPLRACSEVSAVGLATCADVKKLPPAVGLATWSTRNRIFMVSASSEELPICSQAHAIAENRADNAEGSGGVELWSFVLESKRWERLDGSDAAAYGHEQHQKGPWPGARCSMLATVDDSGWILGGVGRFECAESNRNGKSAAADDQRTLHSMVGLWKWEQLDSSSTTNASKDNLKR